MSRQARKCDRCEKLYESYRKENKKLMPTGSGKINGVLAADMDEKGEYYSGKVLDLCEECMQEFEHFIDGGKMVRYTPRMEKAGVASEMVEYVCDKLCRYPNVAPDKETLNVICAECEIGIYSCRLMEC